MRQPLADLARPQDLDAFIGQEHLVGDGQPLRLLAESGNIRSMILWGPPGVGKTTLARILAASTDYPYFELSAVAAGKKDLEAIVKRLRAPRKPTQQSLFGMNDDRSTESRRTAILFLDEIHRFNKAQQDYLLPFVEDGTLILIGATTENPSFEVISALLSRSQVFVLHGLDEANLTRIVLRGAVTLGVQVGDEAAGFLARYANGDARKALNLLEAAASVYGSQIGVEHLRDALQSGQLRYDKMGDEHYDTISAYIKSMRASDADAAIYYLARMLEAGEDPKFIARRLVIFASEDVGLADPQALVLANAVFRAVETVGMPEVGINLAHGTNYMARAPKSRSSYDGYRAAQRIVRETGNQPIPLHLRNAPTDLMASLGYGQQRPDGVSNLPERLSGKRFLDES